MSNRAPSEGGLEKAVRTDVRDEGGAPRQERAVLDPRDALPYRFLDGVRGRLPGAAAIVCRIIGWLGMKAAAFAYHRPTTLADALGLMRAHAPEVAALAGGQSLLPAMNLRIAHPRHVVDLNEISELAEWTIDEGELRIGALVRHRSLERMGARDPSARLLEATAPFVGHPPIRERGTFAGSLAFADPAAEWCALSAMLGARIVLRSAEGERVLSVSSYLLGPYATARRPEEIVYQVRLPLLGPGYGVGFVEESRATGDLPVVCAAAAVKIEDGTIARCRVGAGGIGRTAIRLGAVEDALQDTQIERLERIRKACALAADIADPIGDHHASADYRRHLAGVVVHRAVRAAIEGRG